MGLGRGGEGLGRGGGLGVAHDDPLRGDVLSGHPDKY